MTKAGSIDSETPFDDLLAVWKKLDADEITDSAGMKDTLYALLLLQDREEGVTQISDYLWQLEKRFVTKIAAWLKEHPEDTVEGGFVKGKGNESHATVAVRDRVAEVLETLGGIVRADGGPLSQEFLEGLPANWRTSVLRLNASYIRRQGVSEARLAARGLRRPVKYVITDDTETTPSGEEVQ